MLQLKLIHGIVLSSLPSWRTVFLLTNEKNVMDAHGGRLFGDGSFEHPGQMLTWMVFESFFKYYTHCLISGIFNF